MRVAPPVAETTVHLVRHGEVFNPEGVLYGRLDGFNLSERGRAMAERLGEYFADADLTALRVSPLARAQQTMAPIAAGHPDLGLQIDDRVIEAANDFEGQVFGPRNRALLNPANWWKLRNPLRPSWGEPFTQIASRMRTAIADAADAAGPGGQAVIVSHQLPIWIARLDAEGRRLFHDPRSRLCTLASVTSVQLRQGRVIKVSYDEPARDLIRAGELGANFSSGS